jgi:hypothetical protein
MSNLRGNNKKLHYFNKKENVIRNRVSCAFNEDCKERLMIELTIFNNGPLKPKTCVFSDFLIIL